MGAMDDLKNYYEEHKSETFTKNEAVSGIIKIASAGGLALSAVTVVTWLTTVAVPFLAGLGLPISAGAVMVGLRHLSHQWPYLDTDTKRQICAAVKIFSKFINPFGNN